MIIFCSGTPNLARASNTIHRSASFFYAKDFLGTSFQMNPICDKEHLKYSCNNGIIKARGGDVVEIHINAQERCSCRYRNR